MAKNVRLLRFKHIITPQVENTHFKGEIVASSYCYGTKTEYMMYRNGIHTMEIIAERKFPNGVEENNKIYSITFDGKHYCSTCIILRKIKELFYESN